VPFVIQGQQQPITQLERLINQLLGVFAHRLSTRIGIPCLILFSPVTIYDVVFTEPIEPQRHLRSIDLPVRPHLRVPMAARPFRDIRVEPFPVFYHWCQAAITLLSVRNSFCSRTTQFVAGLGLDW